MHRLFGKSKPKVPPPSLDDASSSINKRVGEIDEKIKQLDKELMGYKEQLKKAKGPAAEHIKKRALSTLQRKKMYQAQRDQMAGQAFNVEQTAFAIDSVKDTQTTVFAMKAAAKTLKAEQKKIKLSEIEDMQDDLSDLLEDTNEIQEALGRSYGIGDEVDDADLEAELACLEDELEGEELGLDSPAYLQPSALPVQPNAVPLPGAPTATATANANPAAVDEYGLPV